MILKRREKDERSERSELLIKDHSPLDRPQTYFPRDQNKLDVMCPTCKKNKLLTVPISIKPDSGGLCSIFISKNLVCNHSFHLYVDMHRFIRGCEPVDYLLGEK